MLRLATRIWAKLKSIWRRIRLVDWAGAVLAILKASKKKDLKVDAKYIVIKPRILSDDNLLRGVAALKAVVAFIPPAAVAAPILGLGEMGFNLWKRISLSQEYDRIKFPPIDPNVLRLSVEFDEELGKHYRELLTDENWNEENIARLEKIFNDFSFITDWEMLRAKYPHIDENYIKTRCRHNESILHAKLSVIEQEIQKVSHSPEIDHNVQKALESLKELFPAMRNWALFNSEGFDELIQIIDTVV